MSSIIVAIGDLAVGPNEDPLLLVVLRRGIEGGCQVLAADGIVSEREGKIQFHRQKHRLYRGAARVARWTPEDRH